MQNSTLLCMETTCSVLLSSEDSIDLSFLVKGCGLACQSIMSRSIEDRQNKTSHRLFSNYIDSNLSNLE